MRRTSWLCVTVLVLSGCAGGGGSLAPVGVYSPVGPKGVEHCATSNHCVVETETGEVHMSIGEQSALTVGFMRGGGDIGYFLDYLVTIKNIGETPLYFDPHRIRDYDPEAAMTRLREMEELSQTANLLAGLSAAVGNTVDTAGLELANTVINEERTISENLLSEQVLRPQTIPPGEKVEGRIILRAPKKSPNGLSVSIPIGSDVHTVRYAKRSPIWEKPITLGGKALMVSSPTFFDGHWLVIAKGRGATNMYVCDLHTVGYEIFQECDIGGFDEGLVSIRGTVRGGVALFDPVPPDTTGYKLIAIDQNTLKYETLFFEGMYKRQ